MRQTPQQIVIMLMLCASVASGQLMSPPKSTTGGTAPPRMAAPAAIKAVVVRSWGAGSEPPLVWDHLTANWSSYGSIPLYIDATSLHAVSSVTLADLEASGADVVIVSDPAGGLNQWSAADVEALRSYANQGHPLIGTYIMFQWCSIDNRALASLWGLRSDLDYNMGEIPSTAPAGILAPASCLFDRIVDPLDHGGYPQVCVPSDLSWDASDLAGASFFARSTDSRVVVTSYQNGLLHSSYISSMPEYQPGDAFDATQFLYNAITCNFHVTPAKRSTWSRVKSLYR